MAQRNQRKTILRNVHSNGVCQKNQNYIKSKFDGGFHKLTLFFKIPLYTKCPHCNKKANDFLQMLKLFGFRAMPDGIHVQSWCRTCRTIKVATQ